jgi:hypothetical protein
MYNTIGRSSAVNNMQNTPGSSGGAYGAERVSFGTWPDTLPSSTATFRYSVYATSAQQSRFRDHGRDLSGGDSNQHNHRDRVL